MSLRRSLLGFSTCASLLLLFLLAWHRSGQATFSLARYHARTAIDTIWPQVDRAGEADYSPIDETEDRPVLKVALWDQRYKAHDGESLEVYMLELTRTCPDAFLIFNDRGYGPSYLYPYYHKLYSVTSLPQYLSRRVLRSSQTILRRGLQSRPGVAQEMEDTVQP